MFCCVDSDGVGLAVERSSMRTSALVLNASGGRALATAEYKILASSSSNCGRCLAVVGRKVIAVIELF